MLGGVAADLEIPLVLVGRLLDPSEVKGDPQILTGISEETLRGVYCAASVLAYPSVYEGFGLPLREAMGSGLPVVAAKRASIPEVCGDAALLVEPEAKAFRLGIERELQEVAAWRKQRLARVQHFSWGRTAEATVRVYQEMVSHNIAGSWGLLRSPPFG